MNRPPKSGFVQFNDRITPAPVGIYMKQTRADIDPLKIFVLG
jgi:hypothetical protein